MDTKTWTDTQAVLKTLPHGERESMFNHFSYVMHSIDDNGLVNVGSRLDIGKRCTHPERHTGVKSNG